MKTREAAHKIRGSGDEGGRQKGIEKHIAVGGWKKLPLDKFLQRFPHINFHP